MPSKTTTSDSKPAPRRVSSESVEGPAPGARYSAFTELGFKKTIDALCEEIRELYLEDQVPWILGYSGGKDSTAGVTEDPWHLVFQIEFADFLAEGVDGLLEAEFGERRISGTRGRPLHRLG